MLREFSGKYISAQFLVTVVALIGAYLLGYGIVFFSGIGLFFIAGIGVIMLVVFTLVLPIEALILAGMIGVTAADSWLVPSELLYYGRFVPMGMLTIRVLLDLLIHRPNAIIFPGSFLKPTLIFSAFAALSMIYSVDSLLTFQRIISMALVVIGFGVGVPFYMTDSSRLEQAIKWIIGTLAVIVLLGTIITLRDPASMINYGSYVRLNGIFNSSNTQGLVAMVVFFPLLWWWQMTCQTNVKIILGGMVFLAVIIVLVSGSRASLTGLISGTVIFFWLRNRSSNILVPVLLLTIPVLLILDFSSIGEAIFREGDSGRFVLWQRAWELGSGSPIWGIGFTASDRIFDADIPYLRSMGIYVGGAHSSYFRMFVDLGILGVILGVLPFVSVLARVFLSSHKIQGDGMVAGMSALVVAGLANAIFESWLYSFGEVETVATWFFLIILALRVEMLSRKDTVPSQLPSYVVPQLRRIKL